MADHETQPARLARVYSEMNDVAIAELAADAASLTEEAREALRTELNTRGMSVELALPAAPDEAEAPAKKISGPLVMVNRHRDMPEAQVAENIFDSAGIDCFLADEIPSAWTGSGSIFWDISS